MSSVDKTAAAVVGFVEALPASVYDLRLVHASGQGAVECRRFDRAGMLNALPWMRARNAADYHVYARPLEFRHVLIDDLGPATVQSLLRHHRPAALVETSPGSFQAWLTVSATHVKREQAAALARLLARRLGGDAGAAGSGQLGRLPGLTNRKPARRRPDGRYPYAILHLASPGPDRATDLLLAALPSEVRQEPAEGLHRHTPTASDQAEAARSKAYLHGLLGTDKLDRSRADYALARRALCRGQPFECAVALVLAGERAEGMAAKSANVYATRTVAAAARAVAGCRGTQKPEGRGTAGL